MSLAPDDPRHGTVNGYVNLACRCGECKEAWRTESAKRRAVRRDLSSLPAYVRHGKVSTYANWSCRCTACRASHAAYQRRWRRAKRRAS